MTERDDFILGSNSATEENTLLSAKSRRRMQKSKADNTLKSYAADWNDFAEWCDDKGFSALPCTPESIVNYINELADISKANTVSLSLIHI